MSASRRWTVTRRFAEIPLQPPPSARIRLPWLDILSGVQLRRRQRAHGGAIEDGIEPVGLGARPRHPSREVRGRTLHAGMAEDRLDVEADRLRPVQVGGLLKERVDALLELPLLLGDPRLLRLRRAPQPLLLQPGPVPQGVPMALDPPLAVALLGGDEDGRCDLSQALLDPARPVVGSRQRRAAKRGLRGQHHPLPGVLLAGGSLALGFRLDRQDHGHAADRHGHRPLVHIERAAH